MKIEVFLCGDLPVVLVLAKMKENHKIKDFCKERWLELHQGCILTKSEMIESIRIPNNI